MNTSNPVVPAGLSAAAPRRHARAQLRALGAALDGSASSIPITLGGVVLVYAQFPAHYLGYGVLAALCALVLVHLASAASARPMVPAARLFEASALAAMLGQMRQLFPAWGLPTEPQAQAAVLLALMCATGAIAGISCALLYLARAHRFTRLIPAPVYAGFANSIALLLVISQSQALWRLWQQGTGVPALLTMLATVLVVCVAARKWAPRWPASALALAAGAAVGLGQWAAGLHTPMLVAPGAQWVLPVQVANFAALWAGGVDTQAVAQTVLASGALLGVMLFINMTVANETLTQLDSRRASVRQHVLVALASGLGAAWGAAPIAPSQQASLAAARTQALAAPALLWAAALAAVVALSGVLGWVALAAVAAAMLCDAYFLADRASLRLVRAQLRGTALDAHQKEDLALILVVTVTAVLLNAVAAVLLGFVLGLLLFGLRNAHNPVRQAATGAQLRSNRARNRYELAQLALDGHRIKVLELERELFFGAVGSLEQTLQGSLHDALSVVLDWTQVRHVDSSVALALVRFEAQAAHAGVSVWHAGAHQQPGNSAALLAQYLPHAQHTPDLDRALEAAENQLITQRAAQLPSTQGTLAPELNWGDALTHFFDGLSEAQRDITQRLMRYRRYNAGDLVFREGHASDSLLLVLQGSVQVQKAAAAGTGVGALSPRLSTVGPGGTVGEIGFLDGAPRSATVTAAEDLLVQELTREAYELLVRLEPDIVQNIVKNLALDLGARLRQATRQLRVV